MMRMPGNFSFRGIDAINQSQSRELAGFDYVAAKRALLNSCFHVNQPLAVVNHLGVSGKDDFVVFTPFVARRNFSDREFFISIIMKSDGLGDFAILVVRTTVERATRLGLATFSLGI
jgi:hypothetical protein